jgi:DNA-binding CsgD family transcriptional regulator
MLNDNSAPTSGQSGSIFETVEPPLVRVLAPRELEVASWVSEGLSNRDIGIIMGLTENTVKKYLMRMFERTGV